MRLGFKAVQVNAQIVASVLAPIERLDGPALRRLAEVQSTHFDARLLNMGVQYTAIAFMKISSSSRGTVRPLARSRISAQLRKFSRRSRAWPSRAPSMAPGMLATRYPTPPPTTVNGHNI
jgi:hypothetical protein